MAGSGLDLNGVASDVKNLKWVTIGTSIVAVAGFVTLLVTTTGLILDSLSDKKAMSQAISDKITTQTNEINDLKDDIIILTEEIRDLKQSQTQK